MENVDGKMLVAYAPSSKGKGLMVIEGWGPIYFLMTKGGAISNVTIKTNDDFTKDYGHLVAP